MEASVQRGGGSVAATESDFPFRFPTALKAVRRTSSTGSCHNAAVNIAWNAIPNNCNQCHQNTADANDWVGNNKAASMISSTEFTAVGHGDNTAPGQPNLGCMGCHTFTATTHSFTANLGGKSLDLVRRYDSLAANVESSFGYGWSLALRDVRVETDVLLTGSEATGVHRSMDGEGSSGAVRMTE